MGELARQAAAKLVTLYSCLSHDSTRDCLFFLYPPLDPPCVQRFNAQVSEVGGWGIATGRVSRLLVSRELVMTSGLSGVAFREHRRFVSLVHMQ